MMDKILLENENNTTGKRVRKINKQRIQQKQPVGYDDESGIENNIEENQLNEIKRLN